jgi:hypothetical protein
MEIEFPLKTLALSDEQYRIVVSSPAEHQRILASAGSGKTTTITARIAYLITHHGVLPESILLATFSRNAAKEMAKRIRALIGPELASQIWCGTFHALAREILGLYAPDTIRDLYFVDELPIRWQRWMRTEKGRSWVGRLRYIIVDEFQDINEQQSGLLDAMQHPGARITVVGDDAQNIYTWRGSNTAFILNFHKRFRSNTFGDYQLRNNYRSSESIIAVANSVMRYIPTLPFKEKMIATRKGGARPNVHFFYRNSDETAWVGKTIQEIRSNPAAGSSAQKTIAILSRYNTDLYRIEEALLKQGILTTYMNAEDEEAHRLHNGVRTDGAIVLSTFHSAKGLEWDIVFCMNLNDDVFPSRKKTEVLGERRLFYVAITRARETLYLTYSNKEHALCRFIREVNKGLLIYNGIAKYALSEEESATTVPSVRDLISLMDGGDFIAFREEGLIPLWTVQTDYMAAPGEGWRIPDCVLRHEATRYFDAFLRLWTRFIICNSQEKIQSKAKLHIFRDSLIERLLFTLRIYGEDKVFWEEWQTEIGAMVKHYFRCSKGYSSNIKSVEYNDVVEWIEMRGLNWEQGDIINIIAIMGKLRGQLVPLRNMEYNIDDFMIQPARHIIPTEWRPSVLTAWKNVVTSRDPWQEIVGDLWRLAACYEVGEGRNAVLYKCEAMGKDLLESGEFLEFLRLKEKEILTWLRGVSSAFGPIEILGEGLKSSQGELLINDGLWSIETNVKNPGLDMWLEWALLGSLARRAGFPVRSVGVWQPLQGMRLSIRIDDAFDWRADQILEKLMIKFVNKI